MRMMWFVAIACVLLSMRGAHSNVGLTSTSFSNELRTGFARLFQNGVEQPLQQQSPFVLLSPTDFQSVTGQLAQRPAPFSPLAATGYQAPRPRYELQHLSWVIPYYYVPTRFVPPRGGKRPNDVLVIVVKTRSNCTANGTMPADGDSGGDDDDVDDDGPNPDDDVEEVSIVTGGTEKGKEPSRCVWAILSCCAPANTPIRYTCFDVLGCSTAFWDTNPCVPAIIQTALDQATQYYGTATSTNRTTTPAPTPPATPAAASTDNIVSLMSGSSTAAAAASSVDQTTPAAATTA
ncbi:uncharacterized protein LOC132924004 isoform X1 [Rhopalosiphum padi]|uniref:uncharacterized protein LOC132924004 isoform X1 n=1 Tax=Rhopalosiphum padi TaxID=40932 RepID=UPI00298DFC61|nr:uncharacterized protein LOC132924004 isoform X1 [Rhopalosiphum padi]